MKAKIFVGIALILTIFLAGSVIIFGLSQLPTFTYLYFSFVLLCFVLLAYSLRKIFVNKSGLVILAIAIILMTLAAAFFAQSAKSYLDKNQRFTDSNQELISQIDNLKKTNDYYISYISFLNNAIVSSQENSLNLQAQIDQLIQQNNQVTQPEVVPAQPIEEIEEGEEEDDD
jgi:hypothetical protein